MTRGKSSNAAPIPPARHEPAPEVREMGLKSAQRALCPAYKNFLFCCPCSPLSRDQGGAQGSEDKQVDPGSRVWYSHLPWHTTDSGLTKTPSSRSSVITGCPSNSAIRATRIAT